MVLIGSQSSCYMHAPHAVRNQTITRFKHQTRPAIMYYSAWLAIVLSTFAFRVTLGNYMLPLEHIVFPSTGCYRTGVVMIRLDASYTCQNPQFIVRLSGKDVSILPEMRGDACAVVPAGGHARCSIHSRTPSVVVPDRGHARCNIPSRTPNAVVLAGEYARCTQPSLPHPQHIGHSHIFKSYLMVHITQTYIV